MMIGHGWKWFAVMGLFAAGAPALAQETPPGDAAVPQEEQKIEEPQGYSAEELAEFEAAAKAAKGPQTFTGTVTSQRCVTLKNDDREMTFVFNSEAKDKGTKGLKSLQKKSKMEVTYTVDDKGNRVVESVQKPKTK
ncbi:MAG: hypothetical protein EOO71_25495 [Myxococcaceae bacterium]|nr:MAG: hypothetical protein EOO71_25495 [Myxococcaceae bacterium]